MQTAIDSQGRTLVAGVRGVPGPGGLGNGDDHLHGRGRVGPDMTDGRGTWVLYMSCRRQRPSTSTQRYRSISST